MNVLKKNVYTYMNLSAIKPFDLPVTTFASYLTLLAIVKGKTKRKRNFFSKKNKWEVKMSIESTLYV